MNCHSCDLELKTAEDHAAKNVSNPYCQHCGHPDGTLKERKYVRNAWLQEIISAGKSHYEAEQLVDQEMEQMPAWKR